MASRRDNFGLMTERRYSEEEVADIFRQAAELEQAGPRAVARGDGLTLAELQQIGREAGFSPELVTRAALAKAQAGNAFTSRVLGMPIGVGRTVTLDRRLSDDEWEQLVSELRETFAAKGVIRYDGPFRQWSNGNLHVLLEPNGDRHRVRFRTTDGISRTLLTGGALTLGSAAFIALTSTASGGAEAATTAISLAAMSAGLVGVAAVRLSAWAKRRSQQMESLARRLIEQVR